MTRASTTLAVAADYADALMTARRAKNWLFILLMLILLSQLAIFLLIRFNVLKLQDRAAFDPAATQPAGATASSRSIEVEAILRYVIPAMDFLGMVFAIVLVVTLLLLVTIMLVGRLIGVSHLTSAFLWCVLLAVFMFPWQAFLVSHERYHTYSAADELTTARHIPPQPAMKVPGVLYTWPELEADHDFEGRTKVGYLKWARYVGFPLLALLVLMLVQAKSSRGLRFALGEADVPVEINHPEEPPPL
jgi:hypothetical protein